MKTDLTETQEVFLAWRAKGHRNRYKNVTLRKQAVNLLEDHPCSVVSKALGVTAQTLKAWQKTINAQSIDNKVNPEFIPIKLNESHSAVLSQKTSPSLTLSLPNGMTLTLSEQALSTTLEFICALSQEMKPCSI